MKKTSLYNEFEYSNSKPLVKQILSTSFSDEFRIVMKKNQEIEENCSSSSIVLNVIEGGLNISLNNETDTLQKGDLVSINKNVQHSLKALENTIVRLSIAKQ